MALVVVGGGRRSGKSRYAQALASAHGPKLAFIGTMRPEDDEENPGKIAVAREERGSSFVTYEEPLEIVKAIEERAEFFDAIVIDDLPIVDAFRTLVTCPTPAIRAVFQQIQTLASA